MTRKRVRVVEAAPPAPGMVCKPRRGGMRGAPKTGSVYTTMGPMEKAKDSGKHKDKNSEGRTETSQRQRQGFQTADSNNKNDRGRAHTYQPGCLRLVGELYTLHAEYDLRLHRRACMFYCL